MVVQSKISESVEHLFRHNAGQMTAVLTRIFGFGKIELIEDAIQESMIRALKNWSIRGVPDNPNAWLIQVARNQIIDRIRKHSRDVDLQVQERELDILSKSAESNDQLYFEKELKEDQLRMMFACCHPVLSPDSQIALTLKTVGGFSVNEIARAFLGKKEAVAKMLVRSKNRLKQESVGMTIPDPELIPQRLEAVLKVLYLMFNEGYSATAGNDAVRKDLCYEAIRLARLLTAHPVTSLPKVNALTALLLFQASRLPARSSDGGSLVVLSDQDRSLWDRRMISEGVRHMKMSARGYELSVYHLEAEIASYHVLSESFEATDWQGLLSAYDELMKKRPSPIVALNRLIAVAEVEGVGTALAQLESLRDEKLEAYYPFHVTLAELQARTGRKAEAINSYEFAAGLIENEAIAEFIRSKIRSLSDAAGNSKASPRTQRVNQ